MPTTDYSLLSQHSPFDVDVTDTDGSSSESNSTSTSTCSDPVAELMSCASDIDKESYGSPLPPTFSDITEINSQQGNLILCMTIHVCTCILIATDGQDLEPVQEVEATRSVALVGYKLIGDNIDKNVRSRYNDTCT